MITSAFLFNFSSSVTICPIMSSAPIRRGGVVCFEKYDVCNGFYSLVVKKSRQRKLVMGLLSLRRRLMVSVTLAFRSVADDLFAVAALVAFPLIVPYHPEVAPWDRGAPVGKVHRGTKERGIRITTTSV